MGNINLILKLYSLLIIIKMMNLKNKKIVKATVQFVYKS